jgi:Uma2 family endonuclease
VGLPDRRQHHSVRDYLSWSDDARCELVHGEIHDMTPAPSLDHQDSVGAAYALLRQYVLARRTEGGAGAAAHVFVAPTDVVLGSDTVVQPDVIVVCDPGKLAGGRHVTGAPDIVVEVASPATETRDRGTKRALYEAAGVREYVLIVPADGSIEVYRRQPDGTFAAPQIVERHGRLRLTTLPGFEAAVADIIPAPLVP